MEVLKIIFFLFALMCYINAQRTFNDFQRLSKTNEKIRYCGKDLVVAMKVICTRLEFLKDHLILRTSNKRSFMKPQMIARKNDGLLWSKIFNINENTTGEC